MNAMKLADRLSELAKARSLIGPELLAREPGLLTQKWLDYRFLSPLEATRQFGAAYKTGIKQYARKHLGIDLASRVEGVDVNLPSNPTRMFTQLWTARQRADGYCMPYEEIIDFSFAFAARRQRKMAPTPMQLFPNPNTEYAWHTEFEKVLMKRPAFALEPGTSLPQYHIEHDRGLPAQTEFREALTLAASDSASGWSNLIVRYHLVQPQLSKSMVSTLIPDDMLEQEFEKAESEYQKGWWGTHTSVALDDADFLQSCFGMQDVQAEASDQCQRCPDRADCQMHTLLVDNITHRSYGSVSPVVAARRATTAARVAKHRAKKAALLRTAGYI